MVIGGTGTTGHRVAAGLTQLGQPVRIGSRRADPPFEWSDPTTWAPVLTGAGAMYIAYSPDLAAPGAGDTVVALTNVAAEHGVRRLVLLSGRGESRAQAAEAAVGAAADAAGVAWTVVRSAWFAQNLSENFLLPMVLDGVIALPAGDVGEPFVDVDDVAAVAVAALTEDGHDGQVYEVTGLRLVTFADLAAELTAAVRRPITYLPVTPAEFVAGAIDHGVPTAEAEMLGELFAEILDGHNSHLTDGVVRALGRQPRDIGDYIAQTATTGVWNVEARV
ncbi:MAG: NmrA family transcriptional regulator [Acidimicrobiia bacterium]|nr:NmrA family transcriptional regulator [Acidimicrobiia bacterium]